MLTANPASLPCKQAVRISLTRRLQSRQAGEADETTVLPTEVIWKPAAAVDAVHLLAMWEKSTPMHDVRSSIQTCKPFHPLTSSQLSCLAECSRLLAFSGGSNVYGDAAEARYVYVVAEGRVRICHIDESGKQSILSWIQPGQLFGELAVCQEELCCDERAEAVVSSKIVAIPSDRLRQVMRESAELSFAMLSLVGVRRRQIESRLKCVLFQSTRHRVVSLLKELAECSGVTEADEIRICQHFSHQDLASMIGITRESVTLALGQLRAEGLIRIDRRQIVIRLPAFVN